MSSTPFKGSGRPWLTLDGEGGYYISNDPEDFDKGYDHISADALKVLHEFETFNSVGKEGIRLDMDCINDYVLYIGDATTPAAAYSGARGDAFDAFYDFEVGYCGSPLADIIEAVSWEQWQENYKLMDWGDDEFKGELIELRLDTRYAEDPETGLSVERVHQGAYDELVGWLYERTWSGHDNRKALITELLKLS